MPYDAWFRAVFDWSPQLAFGWERNHFDRLIHLLFGLCFTTAHGLACCASGGRSAHGHAHRARSRCLVMAASLLYEWLEWAIALLLSPEQAEAYNGQQGDPWDAHMDMLLATLGAIATWPWRAKHPLGAPA